MPQELVTIFDGEGEVIATAAVELQGDYYSGTSNIDRMPNSLRKLFEEFEEIVNGQIFSRLDQIETRIASFPFSATFATGREFRIAKLQIFPNEGTLSFKI